MNANIMTAPHEGCDATKTQRVAHLNRTSSERLYQQKKKKRKEMFKYIRHNCDAPCALSKTCWHIGNCAVVLCRKLLCAGKVHFWHEFSYLNFSHTIFYLWKLFCSYVDNFSSTLFFYCFSFSTFFWIFTRYMTFPCCTHAHQPTSECVCVCVFVVHD